MARRRSRQSTDPTETQRQDALSKARVFASYMLGFEVDDSRRREAEEMTATELRELVAEFPTTYFGREIPTLLDVAEGGGRLA